MAMDEDKHHTLTQIERDIKEIKEKLDRIMDQLGIGKVRPVDVIEIRERAHRDVERLLQRRARRDERAQQAGSGPTTR